ncbi:hypothetical protein PUR61_05365 [Streptomyces sp. BE20]|uniref:hypothetical protein n=1 Tax=Streptomyces sp. BE20 TaxID=3002525 RepID=UPI002E7965A9|nr:hypothetical protein [Streptomyces sp. BE20]MEE1821627.1 hypothetical protein [Streptomyces sp. BE20]
MLLHLTDWQHAIDALGRDLTATSAGPAAALRGRSCAGRTEDVRRCQARCL